MRGRSRQKCSVITIIMADNNNLYREDNHDNQLFTQDLALTQQLVLVSDKFIPSSYFLLNTT